MIQGKGHAVDLRRIGLGYDTDLLTRGRLAGGVDTIKIVESWALGVAAINRLFIYYTHPTHPAAADQNNPTLMGGHGIVDASV
jgi:hypothetical protein